MLSKTAEYALRAAVCLAKSPDEPQSANDLADVTQVPRRYLHKMLQDLVRAGRARAQSGSGGGYALAVRAEETTNFDVANAVSPLERIRHCPFGVPSHTRLRSLHKELDWVYAHPEHAQSRVTLSRLVGSTRGLFPFAKSQRSPRFTENQNVSCADCGESY